MPETSMFNAALCRSANPS